jgi:hypothetical protein
VRFLRTFSTRRLILLVAAVVILAGGGAAIAVAARGGGPTPPPKPLDQAIHDALAAPPPSGITARISFTNKLFPSGALLGNVASALMSGASGRLWATNDGRGRLELQSDAGDAQIVWSQTTISVYDASSNTVYRAQLPAASGSGSGSTDKGAPPTLAEIDGFLNRLGAYASVSPAEPANVGGQPAYSVTVSPKHDGGLLASAELAWDAVQGVPLRVAISAQGSSSPVLALQATQISYGPVAASDVDVSPPAGAKVIDLGSLGRAGPETGGGAAPLTGLGAVQAAAGFPVAAPGTLVGLPRQDVRLVGRSDSKAAIVVYGHGLGAVVVIERKADTARTSQHDLLSSLPSISLDGLTAHELAAELGTAIGWRRGGVDYVLAGSLPPAAAEAAARSLG